MGKSSGHVPTVTVRECRQHLSGAVWFSKCRDFPKCWKNDGGVCRVVLAYSGALPCLLLCRSFWEYRIISIRSPAPPRENQVTWGLGQGQQCKKMSLISLVSGLKDEFLVPCVLPTL